MGFFIRKGLGKNKWLLCQNWKWREKYEAFDVLTGAYSELIKIRDINGDIGEILWNKLKNAKEKNYNICAGTRQLGLLKVLD